MVFSFFLFIILSFSGFLFLRFEIVVQVWVEKEREREREREKERERKRNSERLMAFALHLCQTEIDFPAFGKGCFCDVRLDARLPVRRGIGWMGVPGQQFQCEFTIIHLLDCLVISLRAEKD